MTKFFKENLVLVLGVSLPILLIIFFAIATAIPKHLVDDPKYDFLFVSNYYNNGSNSRLQFDVIDGKLKITHYRPKKNRLLSIPKLYRYNVQDGSVQEISVNLPTSYASENDDDKGKEFIIDELKNLKLNTKSIAPDGYKFEASYRYNRGLLGGMFFYGGSRSGVAISKNARVVKVNRQMGGYYNSHYTKFLGWVVTE